MDENLNPAQQRVLALLRTGGPRPSWDPELGPRLRARLESELSTPASGLDEPLFVSKASLAQVLACETHHRTELDAAFAWSPATARGTVAHKAIELALHRRDPAPPLVLVDDALDRIGEDPDHSLAAYLGEVGESERAELRSGVNDVVAKFVELWPPLARSWAPRTESRVRADLCRDTIRLSGKVDLALGRPAGTTSGTVLIDLKTGAAHAGHLDDLRFYALLETLRTGVPPFRLVGYYLDAGTFSTHDVDETVLEAALRRTVAGVGRIVELRLGLRQPALTPNPACRWCRVRRHCEGARRWAAEREPDVSLE